MTIASYHAESPPAVLFLFGIGLGVFGILTAIRTWRGHEYQFVLEYQRIHGPMTLPSILGGIRLYQTPFGSGVALLPTGIALIAIGFAEFLRQLLARPDDWWLMYAAGYVAVPCFALSFVYTVAYFWTGVPDFMRPPAQRGWKMTKHGYELVRPEAVPPHERR